MARVEYALKDVNSIEGVKCYLDPLEGALGHCVEHNQRIYFGGAFNTLKYEVQNSNNVNDAKRELLNGLNEILNTFKIDFDILREIIKNPRNPYLDYNAYRDDDQDKNSFEVII